MPLVLHSAQSLAREAENRQFFAGAQIELLSECVASEWMLSNYLKPMAAVHLVAAPGFAEAMQTGRLDADERLLLVASAATGALMNGRFV